MNVCNELMLAATAEGDGVMLWVPSPIPTLWITVVFANGPYAKLLSLQRRGDLA